MILDGDILAYFDKLKTDVEYKEEGEISDFSFYLEYPSFTVKPNLYLDHGDDTLTLEVIMEKPSNRDGMPDALNALNESSVFLKSYYKRKDDTIHIEGISFVTEDSLTSVLDAFFNALTDTDSGEIENLYQVIHDPSYQSLDDDSFGEKDDTTIEEDLKTLMDLLGNE